MDSYYDYILSRQDQLLTISQRANSRHRHPGWYTRSWSRIACECGDLLIKAGFWMKRASSAPANDNSLGIYSRN
jgi:hypothetical protein